MTKRLMTISLILTCITFIGCSKRDDEVNLVMKDLDSFTSEMVGKLSTAKDPKTGLSEAQNYFDAKQADIKMRFDSIKEVRGFQLSEATQKHMQDSLTKNLTSVASLQITYMSQSLADKKFSAGLEKLIKEYQEIFKL